MAKKTLGNRVYKLVFKCLHGPKKYENQDSILELQYKQENDMKEKTSI